MCSKPSLLKKERVSLIFHTLFFFPFLIFFFFLKKKVCASIQLKQGNYLIIPTTFFPNQEGNFILEFSNTVNSNMKVQSLQYFVEMSSEWKGSTAGGSSNFPSWRNNPQILLDVFQDSNVQIVLETELDPQQHRHIGFQIFKATNGKNKLYQLQKEKLIDMTNYLNSQSGFFFFFFFFSKRK